MTELLVDGLLLALSRPAQLPLSVIPRDGPHDGGERGFYTATISNRSERRRSLPFDEIRRNLVLVYRNPATSAEQVENRTPCRGWTAR